MRTGDLWYRRQPTAFLGGVQGLSACEIAVYTVALDLIYQHAGPIHHDPKWLAGWISDMGAAAVRRTIEALIDKGKLFLTECGRLHNPGAETYFRTRDEAAAKKAAPPASERKPGKNGGKTEEKPEENRTKTEEKPGKNVPFLDPQANDIKGLPSLARGIEENRVEEKREEKIQIGAVPARADPVPSLLPDDPEDPPPKRRKPETAMPADAIISDAMLLAAITAGMSEAQARAQFEHFKDHALAKARRCADWNAAWRNWLRSPYQNTRATNRRPSTHAQRTDDAFAALGDHLARKRHAGGD